MNYEHKSERPCSVTEVSIVRMSKENSQEFRDASMAGVEVTVKLAMGKVEIMGEWEANGNH